MDQTEARDLLQRIQVAAQKARSNLAETMEQFTHEPANEKINQKILQETQPGLYPSEGKLGILEVVTHTLDVSAKAGELSQMAVYNVLTVANRDEAFPYFYSVIWDQKLPEAMWAYGGGYTRHHEGDSLKDRVKAALDDAGLNDNADQINP